jgi:replicative DNA helicase
MSKPAFNELATLLKAEDFYRPNHANIYQAAIDLGMRGEPVDPMTVARELETRGQLKKVGGAPYLVTCVENTPTAVNAESYARMVLDKAKLRRLSELGIRLKQLAYEESASSDDVAVLMAEGERLFRDQHEPDDRALSFDDLVASWEEWQSTAEGHIRTPWQALNHKLNGGLQRGRLYTIGARPGVGKSVLALNLSTFAGHWGFNSAVFSLEMGRDEVMSRVVAAGASVDVGRINAKNIDLEMRAKIDAYLKENRNLELSVIDRERMTVESIIAHCRSMPKVDTVVVDYLQLLTASDPKASREQQVAHMSRSLKIAARELNVAMVVCSQLNRGPLKDGKVRAPTIADLRESGAIEQDSDCVILLHNDEDDPGIIQMIVGKNRQGKIGDLVLNFEGQYSRITE